ncbi:hypothetical protein SlGVgp033 [Spodoptera litura granulovirus]|uniref:Uncharacterized protein n=1 Tax=Spodoptera litura granulovirus TaxID=359919 RepID=A5IZN5_9BBAC|nr:hypothetical protein SlGVgp033 [Spodoptera litura granulovirus]ABQ51976.1 hypothetical protein SlGVgp033 [Spodoptera litura granulovirus]
MDRVLRQKDIFLQLATQLDKQQVKKLKPLIQVLHFKIDQYLSTADANVLDSLYYLLVDGCKCINRHLLTMELQQKLFVIHE